VRPYRLVFPALAGLLANCADPFGTLSSGQRAPDIRAITVFFTRISGFERIDTLAAGEDVMVMVDQECAGEFPLHRVVVTANADTVSDGQQGCGGGRSAGGRSWTPPGGGVYRFTAVLDADGQFAETDETNNMAAGTLVVLGRRISP
jgi:hypothetical protein